MEIKEYFLNPGELIFSTVPIRVKTLLGSCVSVCIFDKIKKIGGICHYLLPDGGDKAASTKYGNVALNILIDKFIKAGSDLKDLEAHIAGGAFIIYQGNNIFLIGDQNIALAKNLLARLKIRIKSINTGGEQGKRLFFNTRSGTVKVEQIEVSDISDIYNPQL